MLFPALFLWNAVHFELDLQAISLSLPLVFTALYFVMMALLLVVYCTNFRRITQIIWNLVPGYYGRKQLHLCREDQHRVFRNMLWYYRSHKNAPRIAELLFAVFPGDVVSVITGYLPMDYDECVQIEK